MDNAFIDIPQSAPPPEPPTVVVPARVEPILADLARARGVFARMLERAERVVEAMPEERQAEALTQGGHLALSMARVGRALRQVAVLELETMGLREPPAPRGGGSGGGARGDGESAQDRSDLNDIREFDDLYDLEDPDDLEEYQDLESLETCDSYEEYLWQRRGGISAEEEEAELDRRIMAEIELLEEQEEADGDEPEDCDPELPDEEHPGDEETDAATQDSIDDDRRKGAALWRARRAALRRRTAAERRLKRRGRWPP